MCATRRKAFRKYKMNESDYKNIEKIWIDELNLQNSDLEYIIERLPHPKFADFTLNSFQFKADKNGEDWQIASYNNIKDPSWPDCSTYQQLKQLPQHIIDECISVHGFDFTIYENKNISQEQWDQFQSGKWPVWELVRYKNVILDVAPYLQNKTILDFAAHAGIISLMALQIGAKFVKTSNIRQEYVELANKMLNLSVFKNKFETLKADIHDYDNNTKICAGIDTVLLYGIMYHVHDHCQILDSIIQAQPKNIIIDTFVPNSIINSGQSMMTWFTENSENVWNGWFQDRKIIAAGAPNYAWFKLYMNLKNYKSVYNSNYFSQITQDSRPPTDQRSIMVFERIES